MDKQLTETDRNGKAGVRRALANWAAQDAATHDAPDDGKRRRRPPRRAPARSSTARPLTDRAQDRAAGRQPRGPGLRPQGGALRHLLRQLQQPDIGMAARAVLAKNGVETEVVYPSLLRHAAAGTGRHRPRRRNRPKSRRTPARMDRQGLRRGPLVPSCALMLKFEWPLIVPDNDDIKR
jgi:glycerol-3-phosphate dehydrogenase subunit C